MGVVGCVCGVGGGGLRPHCEEANREFLCGEVVMRRGWVYLPA